MPIDSVEMSMAIDNIHGESTALINSSHTASINSLLDPIFMAHGLMITISYSLIAVVIISPMNGKYEFPN